jgi:hypothetical protein
VKVGVDPAVAGKSSIMTWGAVGRLLLLAVAVVGTIVGVTLLIYYVFFQYYITND